MSDDAPVVDLLDQRGRLIRFAIAAAAAIATIVVVGSALYAWVDPDAQASNGGWKFVFYMSSMAGAVVFLATAAVLRWQARRREEADRIPRARIV